MQRTTPPFRADHVGSLLRPPALKEARAKRERNEITAEALRAVEDREIEKAIKKQEEIGLKLATDGEFRRSWWHFDFLSELDGVELYQVDHGIQFHGVQTKADELRIDRQARLFRRTRMSSISSSSRRTPRVTPKMTHPGAEHAAFPPGPELDQQRGLSRPRPFFDDLAKAYRAGDARLLRRRLPLSAVRRHRLGDDVRSERAARIRASAAIEPDTLPQRYARMINRRSKASPPTWRSPCIPAAAISARPASPRAATSPVAERLFGETNFDGYFLEYDTERAGGFEPLRFLPKGKKSWCSGSITSKSGALEKKDDIKRRIDEATKYVALDQLCLSPQCGFASTEEGNVLAEDEQWAKLRLVVELADEVWG